MAYESDLTVANPPENISTFARLVVYFALYEKRLLQAVFNPLLLTVI